MLQQLLAHAVFIFLFLKPGALFIYNSKLILTKQFSDIIFCFSAINKQELQRIKTVSAEPLFLCTFKKNIKSGIFRSIFFIWIGAESKQVTNELFIAAP